jgi:uncharacterized protein YkwD
VNIRGKYLLASLAVVLFSISATRHAAASVQAIQPEAAQLLELANQARAEAGAGPLKWDENLAIAAREHCLRMAAEGPLSHRFPGELDVSQRAGKAGAHFSIIEENVALGPTPAEIHEGWMHSSAHRTNMLNPAVDRVGIAVVASRGVLYATADYSQAVPALTQTQVESAIAALLRARSIQVAPDTMDARSYCLSDGPYRGNNPPSLLMRWQNPDVTRLPKELSEQLAIGRYHRAAVGSCPARDVNGAFTIYRVAVLLY